VDDIRTAILSDDLAAVAELPVPDSYQGMVVRADEAEIYDVLATRDKDPRKSLHLQQVPTPELGPAEAIVAVMASAINYNTVWTSIFEPVSTFAFLRRYGKSSPLAAKHDRPYHVVGSDLAGVVLRVEHRVVVAVRRLELDRQAVRDDLVARLPGVDAGPGAQDDAGKVGPDHVVRLVVLGRQR
jgi:hypothetical protein